MTHITFRADGSHVHHLGRSAEIVHSRDCAESRRLKRILGDDSYFAIKDLRVHESNSRVFDRIDAILEMHNERMRAIREVCDPQIQEARKRAQQPQGQENRVRIHITTRIPAQPKANVEEGSSLFDSVLTVGAIAALALAVGYVGYQNSTDIRNFMNAVPGTLQNAGDTVWDTMQKAWALANCKFSYTGCTP